MNDKKTDSDNINIYTQLMEDIDESDMLLIGIGSEMCEYHKEDAIGTEFYKRNNGQYDEAFYELAKYVYCVDNTELIEIFNKLADILKHKNYFVISTNDDGALEASELNPKRIVAPCGNIKRLQCKCEEVTDTVASKAIYNECLSKIAINSENGTNTIFKESINNIMPKCRICNSTYIQNVYRNQEYNESSYIKQWELYNKWLAATMNKRLTIIELGEGFNMPNLIRWPFEKVTFINNKAKMYRVHSTFYQTPDNIADKSFSVKENALEFIKKIVHLQPNNV